ncbi:hypothetical protein MUK42_33602 [Musa troglodytarum]|uniref:Uncharacterized protein n=1 Tax=Musa troglodytarum TaxID=320322 RepID=A0A9E7LCU2_9LILI|nr:hypothetical protein MUK42_33602 [Musa troglodytarum]
MYRCFGVKLALGKAIEFANGVTKSFPHRDKSGKSGGTKEIGGGRTSRQDYRKSKGICSTLLLFFLGCTPDLGLEEGLPVYNVTKLLEEQCGGDNDLLTVTRASFYIKNTVENSFSSCWILRKDSTDNFEEVGVDTEVLRLKSLLGMTSSSHNLIRVHFQLYSHFNATTALPTSMYTILVIGRSLWVAVGPGHLGLNSRRDFATADWYAVTLCLPRVESRTPHVLSRLVSQVVT